MMQTSDIGAILCYTTQGHNRPCGQTLGANGAGTYAVIFRGDPLAAEEEAHQFVRDLAASGHRHIDYTVVTNEPTYCGPAVMIREAISCSRKE